MERGCTILRFQNSTSLVLFLFYLAFNSYFFQLPLTLFTQWFFISFWLCTFYFNWCSIEPLWLWKRKIMEQLKPYMYDFGFLKLWYSRFGKNEWAVLIHGEIGWLQPQNKAAIVQFELNTSLFKHTRKQQNESQALFRERATISKFSKLGLIVIQHLQTWELSFCIESYNTKTMEGILQENSQIT